jgi:hypothetical protein
MIAIGTVFEPRVPGGFQWILPDNDADFDQLHDLATPGMVSHAPGSLTMHLMKEDDDNLGVPLRHANMPWLGRDALVLSLDLLTSLGSQVQRWGEFLPLECPDGPFFLLRAMVVADALDWDASEVVRFPSSGRVMLLTRPVFHAREVPDRPFKVAGLERGTLFLPGEVVAALRASGATGTRFIQVWSNE